MIQLVFVNQFLLTLRFIIQCISKLALLRHPPITLTRGDFVGCRSEFVGALNHVLKRISWLSRLQKLRIIIICRFCTRRLIFFYGSLLYIHCYDFISARRTEIVPHGALLLVEYLMLLVLRLIAGFGWDIFLTIVLERRTLSIAITAHCAWVLVCLKHVVWRVKHNYIGVRVDLLRESIVPVGRLFLFWPVDSLVWIFLIFFGHA